MFTAFRLPLALAALFTLLAAGTAARAGDPSGWADYDPHANDDSLAVPGYTTVRVANNTAGPISYEFRWGAREWKTYTVQPGKAIVHSLYLPDTGGRRLAPFVAFTDATAMPQSSKLHGSLSDDRAKSTSHYSFEPTARGRNVGLFTTTR